MKTTCTAGSASTCASVHPRAFRYSFAAPYFLATKPTMAHGGVAGPLDSWPTVVVRFRNWSADIGRVFGSATASRNPGSRLSMNNRSPWYGFWRVMYGWGRSDSAQYRLGDPGVFTQSSTSLSVTAVTAAPTSAWMSVGASAT